MKRTQLTLPSFAAALLLLAGMPMPSAAAVAHVNTETILRMFEQETPTSEKKNGLPAYEYLEVDLGRLDSDGVSGHFYGWGRHDFGNFYDGKKNEGELLYGYLQYRAGDANFSARLGRQSVVDGVAAASVDGLRVASDLGRYFSWSAYAGRPVALDDVGGSTGDSIWGAMLSHGVGGYYSIGVSYKRTENDGVADEELVGIDTSLTALGPFSLHGRSVMNQLEKSWQRHDYEARLALGGFEAKYTFQRLDYDAIFDREAATSKPFSDPLGGLGPFGASGEVLTTMGGELSWKASSTLELGVNTKNYAYDVRQNDANYYGGVVNVRLGGLSECGFELGRMEGGVDADTYTLARAFAYYEIASTFLTADVVYAKYGETIFGNLGDTRSLFASLGGGLRFFADALKLKASVEYAKDPYFANDVRGIVALEYDFSK